MAEDLDEYQDNLEIELADQLRDLESQYWDPIDELVDRFVAEIDPDPSKPLDISTLSSDSVTRWMDANVVLEPKYEKHRADIVWHIRFSARRIMLFNRGQRRIEAVGGVATWLLENVVVGGVVAGLSYDVVKVGWQQVMRLRRDRGSHTSSEVLDCLVKSAVVEHCRRLGYPVPEFANLAVRVLESGPVTTVIAVTSNEPDMVAMVEVPYSGIERQGVRVVVHRPNSGD